MLIAGLTFDLEITLYMIAIFVSGPCDRCGLYQQKHAGRPLTNNIPDKVM